MKGGQPDEATAACSTCLPCMALAEVTQYTAMPANTCHACCSARVKGRTRIGCCCIIRAGHASFASHGGPPKAPTAVWSALDSGETTTASTSIFLGCPAMCALRACACAQACLLRPALPLLGRHWHAGRYGRRRACSQPKSVRCASSNSQSMYRAGSLCPATLWYP